jgi:hypothetical protein
MNINLLGTKSDDEYSIQFSKAKMFSKQYQLNLKKVFENFWNFPQNHPI